MLAPGIYIIALCMCACVHVDVDALPRIFEHRAPINPAVQLHEVKLQLLHSDSASPSSSSSSYTHEPPLKHGHVEYLPALSSLLEYVRISQCSPL